ncbi:MAG: carboxypeptidase-like regulatory domain-containing protein [Longimicrobiales bacterium]
MNRRLRYWMLAAVAVAAAVAARGAGAQTPGLLRGNILDRQTLAPIGGAFVGLESARRGVLSDSTGYFALPVGRADRYVVRVRQLGYKDLATTLEGAAADRALVLQMEPDPVELEGLTVLAERFQDRRRGIYGAVDVLDHQELLKVPDGASSDLVRRLVPFARPCDSQTEDLCVNAQGRIEPLVVCVDERRVAEGMVELERLDPRGLHMVEVFRRGGQVRLYSRGYVERLLASGAELPPLSFGCGAVGLPGPGIP